MSATKVLPPPAGIYTPLVTFFNEDSTLDLDSISKHALRIAKGGVAGLVLQGSNGEAVHLDNQERQDIIHTVRKTLDAEGFKAMTLIVGAGAPSERATLQLTREAAKAGADYVLVLPPSYWPNAMTKGALEAYYRNVADGSPIPLLVYNFPLVANGINVDSDLMLSLSKHPKIVGCKLTCGNLGNLHRICAHTTPDSFATLSGKAEFALHGFVGGASGCIAALVNLAPKSHVALFTAYQNGDWSRAKQIQDVLSDADLAQSRLGVAGLKLAVSRYFGYGSGTARSPLLPGSEATLNAQDPTLQILMELENSL